jgi:hypothetical protein
MKAAEALQDKPHTSRNRRSLLQHAKLAFGACEATNLVLFVDVLLSELPQSTLIMKRDEKTSMTESSTIALSEGFLSHDVGSVNGSEELNKMDGRESDPSKQKLGLESILRSFLILASERDSDGLIRRVLQVLLQVTCTNYACFATQDPATGSLKLKGYGTYDDIKICDIAIAEAKDIAPTVLLSHCSITKKVSNQKLWLSLILIAPNSSAHQCWQHLVIRKRKSTTEGAFLRRHRASENPSDLAALCSGQILGPAVPVGQGL